MWIEGWDDSILLDNYKKIGGLFLSLWIIDWLIFGNINGGDWCDFLLLWLYFIGNNIILCRYFI